MGMCGCQPDRHDLKDFTTWGPMASRIVELQLEKNAAAGA